MNFRNIKVRLLTWYSVTVFMLLVIFSFSFGFVFYNQEIKLIDTKLLTVKNYIEHNIEEKYQKKFKSGFSDEEEEFSLHNLLIKVYKVENNKNTLLTKSGKMVFDINYKTIDKNENEIFTYGDDDGKQIRGFWFYSHKIKNQNIYVEISTTLNDKLETKTEVLNNSLLYIIPLVIFLFILIGYMVINKAFKDVKNVVKEVSNIKVDDLSTRLSTLNSDDEIDELIMTFNNMLEKIEQSMVKIRRFSNDVSHELKTPLTVIMGELELGLRSTKTNEEYKNILVTSFEETKQLKDLIDNLLLLSSMKDSDIKNKFVLLNFDDILVDVISKFEQQLKVKKININFVNIEETKIRGNEQLLNVMLKNLIQNAIKYSNENSTITISLENNICVIKDTGIGIKKNELDKIFDRFYRVDESRIRGGHGLGLSIVKSACFLHQIDIQIKSEYKKYTKIILNLE